MAFSYVQTFKFDNSQDLKNLSQVALLKIIIHTCFSVKTVPINTDLNKIKINK